MCLIVKRGCKIEIAEKDITTYKYIYDGKDYWCGIFYPYPQFLYNEVQKAKLSLDKYLRDYINESRIIDLKHLQIESNSTISEGFHSHVNPVVRYPGSIKIKRAICIIPKGSEYCFGNTMMLYLAKLLYLKQ